MVIQSLTKIVRTVLLYLNTKKSKEYALYLHQKLYLQEIISF